MPGEAFAWAGYSHPLHDAIARSVAHNGAHPPAPNLALSPPHHHVPVRNPCYLQGHQLMQPPARQLYAAGRSNNELRELMMKSPLSVMAMGAGR